MIIYEKIITILDEEKRAYAANGRIRGGLGSFNHRVPNEWTMEGQIPQVLDTRSSADSISSPNATTLVKLYSSLASLGEKSAFKEALFVAINKGANYADVGYLILFVLYKIGDLVPAAGMAKINLAGDTNNAFDNFMAMLALIIKYQYTTISEDEYGNIERLLKDSPNYDVWLKNRITAAKTKIIERELDDINPAINADRDKLVSAWEAKFGKGPLTSTIEEIERSFSEGEFTQTKYASCIGRVRVLISGSMQKIASEISLVKSDGKITTQTSEQAIFDYLRGIKFISDGEWQITKGLYGLTSDQGSHKLESLREYARITKNMAYELILLCIDRFQKNK